MKTFSAWGPDGKTVVTGIPVGSVPAKRLEGHGDEPEARTGSAQDKQN